MYFSFLVEDVHYKYADVKSVTIPGISPAFPAVRV